MSRIDIGWASAGALAEAMREGVVSAVEVAEEMLRRIEAVNPLINAYVTIDREQVLREAHAADARRAAGEPLGPLHGVPVSIKDIIFTRGLRTTAGSKLYESFVPDEDAIVVRRLRQAGAVIIGKVNTSEFGHKPVTDNPLFGETRNPWDVSRTAGGSSGGSGAAVAAGLAPVSIGNDGGGSVRMPAALCGVVGFKPTFGRIPQYPGFPGWDQLGHTGPFARSVADVRLVMQAVDGADVHDPRSLIPPADWSGRRTLEECRVGWAATLNDVQGEPEVGGAVEQAAMAFEEMGWRAEQVTLDWSDPQQHFRTIVGGELMGALEAAFDEDPDRFDATLVKFLDFSRRFTAADFARACAWRLDFTRRVFAWFEDYDLLVVPTCPVPAIPLGSVGPRQIAGRKVSPFAWLSWAYPFNLTGQPSISVPSGMTEGGLPLGVQIVGRFGEDGLVLDAAEAFEQRRPFAISSLRPPVAA